MSIMWPSQSVSQSVSQSERLLFGVALAEVFSVRKCHDQSLGSLLVLDLTPDTLLPNVRLLSSSSSSPPLLPPAGSDKARMCSPSYTSSMKDRLVNNLLDVTLQGKKVIIIKLSENGCGFTRAMSLPGPLLSSGSGWTIGSRWELQTSDFKDSRASSRSVSKTWGIYWKKPAMMWHAFAI